MPGFTHLTETILQMVFCFKLHKFCSILFHYFVLFCVVSVPRCWSSGRCLNVKRSEDAGNQTFGNVEANA